MSVDVKEQVNLPLAKCLELVLSGIQYRLFRAGITVTIISLAVAFLMVMLSESLISRQVATAVEDNIAPRRLLDKWVSRLSSALTEQDLVTELASLQGPQDERWDEFKFWGDFRNDSDIQKLHDIAAAQLLCQEKFFDKLPKGRRRLFVGTASGTGIFTYLVMPGNLKQFEMRLKESDRKLPMTFEDFNTLLADWKATCSDRQKIMDGHLAVLEPVKAVLGNKQALDALAQANDSTTRQLAALGFKLSSQELVQVQTEAKLAVATRKINDVLKVRQAKQMLADRCNVPAAQADTDLLFREVSSSSGSMWLAKLASDADYQKGAARAGIAPINLLDTQPPKQPANAQADSNYQAELNSHIQLNAQQIRSVAQAKLSRQNMADIESLVSTSSGSKGGFDSRTLWLILVSFLVCVVGIANAMLMSVTERFREIATMKCLGATDKFIMINFILESVMQGVAGGIIGSILGFVLGALRAWITYGQMAWQDFPLGGVMLVAGGAMVVGVVVSALAAVYPAYVAARLAPMEAMRIE